MEVIIKIEGFNQRKIARDVLCDLCNADLSSIECIFAVFWKDRQDIYLEKYVCPTCHSNFFKKRKCISFADAPNVYKQALERDFNRDWHGVIVPVSSMEELQLLMENPTLFDSIGEKF